MKICDCAIPKPISNDEKTMWVCDKCKSFIKRNRLEDFNRGIQKEEKERELDLFAKGAA